MLNRSSWKAGLVARGRAWRCVADGIGQRVPRQKGLTTRRRSGETELNQTQLYSTVRGKSRGLFPGQCDGVRIFRGPIRAAPTHPLPPSPLPGEGCDGLMRPGHRESGWPDAAVNSPPRRIYVLTLGWSVALPKNLWKGLAASKTGATGAAERACVPRPRARPPNAPPARLMVMSTQQN